MGCDRKRTRWAGCYNQHRWKYFNMKDYEFLRWLVSGGPTPRIPLVQQETRLLAIADQIERLSNPPDAPESLRCQLSCGHELWLFNPKMYGAVMCPRCPAPTTVAKIWFKEPTPAKRLCVLSCGHHRFVDNPRIGLHILCPICPGMCQRVVSY